MIAQDTLKSFKARMRITHMSEDDYLKELLVASYEDIKEKCGEFDLDTPNRGRELVFERSRYIYNDALEYFNDNFLSQINSFAIANLTGREETDATE